MIVNSSNDWKRTVARVLAGLAATAILVPSIASALDEAAKKKVVDYYRRKANLPPEATAELTDVKDSKIAGLQQGTIKIGSAGNVQNVDILMSADGQYVIFSGVDRNRVAVGGIEDVNSDPFAEVMKRLTLDGNPSKGPADAAVTIVEFSDFQCPYCARAYTTLKTQVLKEYDGKVRVVYKNFPLSFHKWAEPAGIAGECAYEQDEAAFWLLYSYYFDNQRQLTPENIKEKTLEALKETSVDADKWADCFDNKKTADKIRADMAEGQSVGVTGTPAFIINGRFLSGAQPFPRFKAIIDDELARAGQS
jgi:protein-disulfide isomerase